ncbi:hypothetical protein [Cyclobacterium sp.]|uniref:hypothetical protein n=1 Tax=Cyclobacterium sp. TaxID=1966343 RepID=UPI0019C91A99|nr:hypothetical protein [Cyclobacterium sp.]MBD3630493.1 hypothetical protein [Cyclobacterium sp.]
MNITVDLSFLIAVKDMREEQRRFFQLTKEAKAKKLPKLWAQRKNCLDSSRQLEALVDIRLEQYLEKKEVRND